MTLVYSCMAVLRAGTVILSTLFTAVSRLGSPVCRTFWHATALARAPVQGDTALVATRCCSSHGFSSRHLLHDTYTKQNLLQHVQGRSPCKSTDAPYAACHNGIAIW